MEIEQYTVIQNRLLEHYHSLGFTNEEFMFLIHVISFQQLGNKFPSMERLGKRMGCATKEVIPLIESLMNKGGLAIQSETEAGGRQGDRYSLAPLFDKLAQYEQQSQTPKTETNGDVTDVREILTVLETEFGRQLSPMEYELVSSWIVKEGFLPDTIKAAIKEAVLNGVSNLRYIERILFNWRKNNRKTTSHEPIAKATPENKPDFPIHKVLNNDNKK
ncbi:MAG: DnaD domain protein [Aerococcus sp.]|nr:DnaD domain protein [Aerococcus sp.]